MAREVAPALAEVGAPASARPKVEFWMAVAVFLPALAIRLINIGQLRFWLEDQLIMVPTGANYTRFGFLGPDNWFTQPAIHVLTYVGQLAFGNDPIGWAMRSALFGAGTVLMTFLITRRVFRRPFPAIAATTLVALDPTGLSFARATTQDIPAAFFILGMLYFFLRAHESDRELDWVAAGVSAGIAVTLRWYAILPLALTFVLAIVYRSRDRRPQLVSLAAYLGVLPVAIYVAYYLPWAARGYALGDWMAMQIDAFRFQSASSGGVAINVPQLAGPAKWFFGWLVAGGHGPVSSSYSVILNDPVLWILFVPSAAYLMWRGIQGRHVGAVLIAGSFLALSLFFVTAPRTILLYSALPIIPLGFIGVGFTADRLLGKRAWIFLAVAVVWSLYLFPLTCGLPVPEAPYLWILRMAVRT